jgi:hypothetical protein
MVAYEDGRWLNVPESGSAAGFGISCPGISVLVLESYTG